MIFLEDASGAKTSDHSEVGNRGGPSTVFGRNDGKRPIGPTTGKVIVEIQPMRAEKRRNSSPFLGLRGKKSEKETGLHDVQDRTDTIYEVSYPNYSVSFTDNRWMEEGSIFSILISE